MFLKIIINNAKKGNHGPANHFQKKEKVIKNRITNINIGLQLKVEVIVPEI